MNYSTALLRPAFRAGLVLVLSVVLASAQQNRATLRGLVIDELGAAIVGASVTLTDSSGVQKNTTTGGDGGYSFNGLIPGKYLLQASAKGFATSDQTEVEVKAAQRETFDLTLKVTIEEQKVTVAAETPLSTESTNNANQTLITGKDLDALPDDPDELAAALQALAGPSMGPNGGQIYIDGFTGGRPPSKDSIREIRINQNPFAAENDLPSGRIDILTRPGTDKLRGSSFFNFEDESFDSRNPFATSTSTRSPFQLRQYGGSLAGPIIKKKASFFVESQRIETDDSELVKATVLDANLNPVDLGFGVGVPRRFTSFSPRIDYQINDNNTLVTRYTYNRSSTDNNGVGGFSLPERAFNSSFTIHTFQVTETAVLNASMIDETRFQYSRQISDSLGDNSVPGLNVSSSFFGGSSQVGHVENVNQRWEIQNFLAWQKGTHALKFGGRLRGVHITDTNPNNFGGTYTFAGALVPTLNANNQPITSAPIFVDSLERYRRTLLGQELGLSPSQIRAMGGGASQFNINAGNPTASVSQVDVGFYAQDDWRVKPNLTLSFGLRYENQTNIHSLLNFAPRLAVAWSPGAANSARPPKMVIRAGGGVFYNRFNENSTLQAHRFNGVDQQQFFLSELPLYNQAGQFVGPTPTPLDLFPNVPPLITLGLVPSRQVTWRVVPDLHTPTVYMGGAQVERQLPYRFTMFAGYFTFHIQHVIRARDINAPLPGSITQANPNGVRPFGNVGEIYQYESTGRFDQQQIFIGFNNRFNRAISFFSSYSLSKTKNDTDGQGGQLFPVNSYDLRGEYGRAGFDIRHRFTFFGTVNLPWWQLSLNPFLTAFSGRPFNITTGQDLNGDRLFTERPSFAPAGTDCSHPAANIVCTRFGNFNLRPSPGEALIPRNFGAGPSYLSVNLRITKTWGFGSLTSKSAAARKQPTGQATAQSAAQAKSVGPVGGNGARPVAGPSAGGGDGGAKRAAAGSASLTSVGVPGRGAPEAKRYTMQFSVNFNNIFNKVNLNTPVGNLSSPFFGESLSLASSFGGFGPQFGGGGSGGGSGVGNRRISAQVRFNF